MMSKAFISGCEGLTLTGDEKAFFADAQPWGFILFGRNIDTPAQVIELVESLRESIHSPDAPILIDQEGGRVQRLKSPHWPKYPPAATYGSLYAYNREYGLEAACLSGRLIGDDLARLGIDMDCMPVLDVATDGLHDVIGDRAYGHHVEDVVALGRAAADGLLQSGVLPIIKHIPGHGRAQVDSHYELPVVSTAIESLEESDFQAFKSLKDLPVAMSGHILFSAIDDAKPATLSPLIIHDIIRRYIGFDGLLLTDDISMNALGGTISERAHAAVVAGCDLVLHCNGVMSEMIEVASAVSELDGLSLERAKRALAMRSSVEFFDRDKAFERFTNLIESLNVA